ncbi:recombinase family protein [Deinococcus sp. QL22]|uniref:recombinase family protein n=1 Tax=Deinococcus sp. QL22 TaxID=2939437 RepID=UPI002017AAF6|nr:recombinase family protein [Deinococcus sp. QL22]
MRVSDPRGDTADRFGLAVQERACREYAERLSLPVHQVYTDAITGTTETRIGFGKLLADAPAYTDVIIYAVDRLARHPRAGYALLETLQSAGLQVHTAIEGMLDLQDDAGALNFGVRIVMADAERRRIVRRMMEGKKQKVRGGKPLQPLSAYGYQDGEIYEPQAQWVRWIFEQALKIGTHELSAELGRLGVLSPTGKPNWDRDSIRKVLMNSVYRGEYIYGRERVSRRPLAESISCPVPRIVTDEVWYAVQRAMIYRSTGAGRRGSRTDIYPLTGRLRCGECAGAMVGCKSSYTRKDGSKSFHYYYSCGDRALSKHTKKGCDHLAYYRAERLHEAIWGSIRSLAAEPLTAAQQLIAPPVVRLDTTAAIRDLDGQLSKARAAYLRGIDTEDEYAESKTLLTAQRARLLALSEEGAVQPVADLGLVQRALSDAVGAENLYEAVVRLGLMARVVAGGEISLTLDPG